MLKCNKYMIIFLYSLYFFPYYVTVDGNIKDLEERIRATEKCFLKEMFSGGKNYRLWLK
jgi:hypothetical protein